MRQLNVTQTFLPDMSEYSSILQRAFDKNWLTNRGELVQELEEKLKAYLDVNHLTLTTNGTLPIQIALKALGLEGEIITTPFSYVATTSSIVWEGCTPVFVDIHPEYFTIDESKIEAAITAQTTGILATHVFGNPCEVNIIEDIAKKHNLKVIYDAAHCFGVKYNSKGIFNYGDVNTCSFHATKIFHTGEGGCWTTNDDSLQQELYYHHNFGHNGPEHFHGLGINAKMSELQAAMGLAVFNHLPEIFALRKKAVMYYDDSLEKSSLQRMEIRSNTDWNYHYYPVVFQSETDLLEAQKKMNQSDIYPRRYFYPSLNKLPYVSQQPCPISERISKCILCLPLWAGIEEDQIQRVVKFLI